MWIVFNILKNKKNINTTFDIYRKKIKLLGWKKIIKVRNKHSENNKRKTCDRKNKKNTHEYRRTT